MNETIFWIAYFCAFLVTLALGFALNQRLGLISILTAALSSITLAAIGLAKGGDLSDPWLGVALFINFAFSWCAAAVAIYIVKFVRA